MSDSPRRNRMVSRFAEDISRSDEEFRDWMNSSGGQITLLVISAILAVGFLYFAFTG